MGTPGVRQVPEGSGEQGNMAETGCEIICGAPTTLAVKGSHYSEIEENLKNNSKRAYELVKDLTTVKQGKMEETSCKIIYGVSANLAVKG